jgi:UDP-N-acetylmuramate--alanine ligase
MARKKMQNRFSLDVGVIHFIGIGGIGMSGIAEILNNLGYKVQGSDSSSSYVTKHLSDIGIKVMFSQEANNIEGASVIVKSSAVRDDNPEIIAARAQHIPVIKRAEMLAELMRLKSCVSVAGTHGKTTTTTMVTAVFDSANLDPTVINGGIINSYGSNAHLGKGDWLVAEADESDGSFLRLPATIAIITNIDPEHLENYSGSFDVLRKAFRDFIENIPFYGFGVMCVDHPEVRNLWKKITDRKIITYAIDSVDANIKAENIHANPDGSKYDVRISGLGAEKDRLVQGVYLSMPGIHNVQNSLAAISIAAEFGLSDEEIRQAFSGFKGIKRRFTKTGEVGGIKIIDDYGHHPKEIAATLKTAKQVVPSGKGRVIAVLQPHRFTRVRDLFNDFCACFGDADVVIVSDIYKAGEEPIAGINMESLVRGLKEAGNKEVYPLNSHADLAGLINNLAESGDIVVCLGAGDVTKWAASLPAELAVLGDKKVVAS